MYIKHFTPLEIKEFERKSLEMTKSNTTPKCVKKKLRIGTKNNSTSSNFLLDNFYTIGLLL